MKKTVYLIMVLALFAFSSWGTKDRVLRVVPTLTPIPTKAEEPELPDSDEDDPDDGNEEQYRLELDDEEMAAVITEALGRMKDKYADTVDDKALPTDNSETDKYADGSRDVVIFDDDGNEKVLLMYGPDDALVRAMFNEYKDGKVCAGAEYTDGKLTKYFETAGFNGKFYLEAEPKDAETEVTVSIAKGEIVTFVFDDKGGYSKIAEA